jgi:Uncharacterized conserved protein (COG2071)
MIADSVACLIQRRLLVNYRIDPDLVAPLLPSPLRPQLAAGHAVGGVCFIRLGRLRAGRLPGVPGLTTENAAHRFAVEWDDASGSHVGVYVPRRDTNSALTSAAGGRIFPGCYLLARFTVEESADTVRIAVDSRDGHVRLAVTATANGSDESLLFATPLDAGEFFRAGALGLSPRPGGGCLDGVRLQSTRWAMQPMTVQIASSLFDDRARFPAGTCTVDSAYLMRDIPARWSTDAPPSAN